MHIYAVMDDDLNLIDERGNIYKVKRGNIYESDSSGRTCFKIW